MKSLTATRTGGIFRPDRSRQRHWSLAQGPARLLVLLGGLASGASADEPFGVSSDLNFYGLPGLIDMPNADMMPDGEIAFSVSNFAGMTRGTLAFQIMPRVVGSFRYSSLQDLDYGGYSTYYDRSFDVRFQLLTETATRPGITLGLQDFVGTGLYSAEYVVATKTFADTVSVTGGIGWGRLGSQNTIGSTGTRPDTEVGEGGSIDSSTWLRGDMAFFGGLAWRPTPKLTLKAEYSSDAYTLEDETAHIFEIKTPFNFGIDYEVARDFHVGAYALYGSEVGLSFSVNLNPARPALVGTLDPAPVPVLARPSRAERPDLYVTTWVESPADRTEIRDQLAKALLADGLELEALELTATTATVYLRNPSYTSTPQAIGRTVRHLSRWMPSSIETFTVIQMVEGMALPAMTFSRTDVEIDETEPDGAERMLAAAVINPDPALPPRDALAPDVYPRFNWDLGPYVRTSLFDPDAPLRGDVGIAVGARYQIAPRFLLGASVQKKLAGNLNESKRPSNSTLPHVRSDFNLYDRYGDPNMAQLYGAYYFQPAQEVYGMVTVGYLERMHAGISGEVLWAPYNSRLALGAQLNYTQQRDFDGGFGLQDYQVATGFGSVYWRFADDFFGQVDVGRYLAGDTGATVSFERVFPNGWRVGAFATFTDASSEEFGEGGFDKGITMTIPLNWVTGRSTRLSSSMGIRPLTRDGGAQLEVPLRLFPLVEDGRSYSREGLWGSFWR